MSSSRPIALCLLVSVLAAASTARAQNKSPDHPAPAAPGSSVEAKEPEGGEYIKQREEHIARLRGWEPGKPFDARLRGIAIEQMEKQMAERDRRGGISAESVSSLAATWTELGPAPIPNGQTTTSAAVSGRVTAIEIDPSDPNKVYVGTAQGGVYRSLNGGSSWTPIFDSAQSLAIGALALDAAGGRLYVGTGEPNNSGDSFGGVGLYRIDNVNASPTLVGPINPTRNYNDVSGTARSGQIFTGASITRILIVPNDPNTLFVGTSYGVMGIGADWPYGGSIPPLGIAGLYRLGNAAGAAGSVTGARIKVTAAGWCFDTPCTGDRAISDMVFDPADTTWNTLLVWQSGDGLANDGGVFRSTNARAATPTFTQTFIAPGRGAFALYKQDPNAAVVYIATSEAGACPYGYGALRVSTNAGVSFGSKLTGGDGFCGGQCWYDIGLAVHPGTSTARTDDVVLLGGAFSYDCVLTAGKSTNGGGSFTDVGGPHADTHVIKIAPSNASIVYRGDDGGIWKSSNAGSSWTSLNNSTFRATQFQSLALHPTSQDFTIGGTQDNGTNHRRADGTWNRADAGDGGFTLIDQNATDTTNVVMYHTYYNVTGGLIGYARATTGSPTDGSWSFRGCSDSVPTGNDISCGDAVLFYAPMAAGPGNPNRIYFGTDRLYRSTNRGDNHSVVSQAPLAGDERISAIAISPQDDNYRLVGLEWGSVYYTRTGSSTLTLLDSSGGGVIPDHYIARVAFDPANKNTAYIAVGGYMAGTTSSRSHVWKVNLASTPPALSAINGSGGSVLPDVPVNAFAVDPQNSARLFAGTDIGVYITEDGGATWTPFGSGLPRVAVFDMAVQNVKRVLRIATHGRGLWEIAVPSADTSASCGVTGVTTTPVALMSPPSVGNLPPGGTWQRTPRDNGESWTYTFTIPPDTANGAAAAPKPPEAPPTGAGASDTRQAPAPSANDGSGAIKRRVAGTTAQDVTGAATVDVVAERAYLLDEYASEVRTPSIGQVLYIYGDYTVYGSGTDFWLSHRAVMDGSVFCSFDGYVTPGWSYYAYCNGGWTATAGTHTLRWDLDYTNAVPETSDANNSASRTFTPAGVDVAAQRAYLMASSGEVAQPTVGQSIWFYTDYAVWGVGGSVGLTHRALLDGTTFCSFAATLTPGKYYYGYCYDPWVATAGTHTLRWDLDYTGSIPETSESNNSASKTISAANSLDIVTQRSYLKNAASGGSEVPQPTVGQPVYFFADYYVTGTGSTLSVAHRAVLDGTTYCSFNANATPGGTYNAWCGTPWTATSGTHTLRWDLDYTAAIAETNESNNSASATITPTAGVDIAAQRAYLRTAAANGGTEVDQPVVGQTVFFHGAYQVTGGGTITVTQRAVLDGTTFCSCQTTASAGHAYVASCNQGWTVTAGAHTLRWDFDYANGVTETDESNNSASKSMTAGGAPVATTSYPSPIAATTATLRGTVNPNGASTTTSFDYGKTVTYGSTLAAQTLTGSATQSISAAVSGLTCGTIYHFRAKAQNASGLRYGADATFPTAPCAGTAAKRGDFTRDGKSDLLFRKSTTGEFAMWELNGRTLLNGAVFATMNDPNWKILGFGDFNDDGYDDVFFRHATSGATAMWLMRGRSILTNAASTTVADLKWEVQAIGDFNADGKDELIWRHRTTGDIAMWEMNGVTLVNGAIFATVTDQNWQIELAADFNGDGKDELLWRNSATGALAMWTLNGRTLVSGPTFATLGDRTWQIVSVGDYNGDKKADLLWRQPSTNTIAMWEMNGTTVVNANSMLVVAAAWQAERSGDFDGDNKDEVIWRNTTTGEVAMWELAGHTLLNGNVFYTVGDLTWKIQPRGGVHPLLTSN